MKQYWFAQVIMFVAMTLVVRFGLQGEVEKNSTLWICGMGLAFSMCIILHICIKNQNNESKR